MTLKRTAGVWSPQDARAYFIAADTEILDLAHRQVDNILVAVNEMRQEEDFVRVERWIDHGVRVLVDSGVFWLVNKHAQAHDLTMNQALSIAPEEVDGYDELMTRYLAVIARLGKKCWGYIEVDQGGRKNKKRVRAKLERQGLEPIPVYHPLNDGAAYFDELASQYARICHANVVMADPGTRMRLAATVWEKRQKYPHLWVHFLGMSPSECYHAYPPDSCDSSAWLRLFSWDCSAPCDAMLRTFGNLDGWWTYDVGVDTKMRSQAVQFAAQGAYWVNRTWRQAAEDAERALGKMPTRQVIRA